MKFTVRCTSLKYGRTGLLSNFNRLSDVQIETPGIMLFTKGASLPHLTREVLELLSLDQHIVQYPLLTTSKMITGVKHQGKGLAYFAALDKYPSFMTFQDPTVEIPLGKFESLKMPLWSRTGKVHYDADTYMDTVECFKPDMYSVLFDGCTEDSSSKKRTIKSVERSKEMFERCLERHKESEFLRDNSSVFGVIVGGDNLEQRQRCLDFLLKDTDHLTGFILDGIDRNGPLLENKSFDDIKTVTELISNKLPNDKMRIAQGCWNAVTVLDLVLVGWDLFDTSLPFQSTERRCALTFSFTLEKNVNYDTDDFDIPDYEISLNHTRFKEDFTPLLKGCKCLCCSKYSRAYINHLINTKELLADVLLMIHNLHHYVEYFKCIRSLATTEEIVKLRAFINKQYIRRTVPQDPKEKTPEIDEKIIEID